VRAPGDVAGGDGYRAPRRPRRPRQPAPRTGADGAYELLRRRIQALELAPGADLDEETLAEQCGVSRTPLREALIRLATDHLVVLLPNRGYAVAPLLLTDLPHFVEALAINQGAVNALAAERRSEGDLRRIEEEARRFDELLRQSDTDAITEQNRAFHLAIGDACRNEYFIAAYRRLLDESVRLARTCFAYDAHKHQSAKDHRAMIEAIGRQDAAAAERSGREHALAFQQRILAYLEANDVGAIRAMSDRQAPPSRGRARTTSSRT
jgi:DNA-binding GntR family transcriptional regulator